jgi:ubiquinone/menaquinone biosynthesis C-methylase UbiE
MAPLFDFVERGGGERLHQWRLKLWSKVEAGSILEVGVGTGANFAFYPGGSKVTAIDLSAGMLRRASEKASRMNVDVSLEEMDVQALRFEDDSFDAVVATLVFCAVPDPIRGLAEIGRVCKPGCKALFLEHVRSANPVLGPVMDFFNPLVFWTVGDNLNRRTAENVARSGLKIENITDLSGIFKLIEARKP